MKRGVSLLIIVFAVSCTKDIAFPVYPQPGEYEMPTLSITTDSGKEPASKQTYLSGTYLLVDMDRHFSPSRVTEGTLGVKRRGNSTFDKPKHPYRLELSSKESLLGMPSDSDWVLLAEYSDKTLLRNRVAMHISEICGMPWTPMMRSVELTVNGDYRGVFTLAQKPEYKKGFYLEIDENMDERSVFRTYIYNMPMMFRNPVSPLPDEREYVVSRFNAFEKALSSVGFDNPTTGYRAYIDVDSFVNFYIVQELTKNVDGNTRRSSYMTIDRDGKLVMRNVWDFDIALGNCDFFPSTPGNGPAGYYVRTKSAWYKRLFQDPWFVERVRSRYRELLPQLRTVNEWIDSEARDLYAAAESNFKRWPVLSQYLWPNAFVGGTYDAEIAYLKEFYSERLNWLSD